MKKFILFLSFIFSVYVQLVAQDSVATQITSKIALAGPDNKISPATLARTFRMLNFRNIAVEGILTERLRDTATTLRGLLGSFATKTELNDTATALRASNYRDADNSVVYVRVGADNNKALRGEITRPFFSAQPQLTINAGHHFVLPSTVGVLDVNRPYLNTLTAFGEIVGAPAWMNHNRANDNAPLRWFVNRFANGELPSIPSGHDAIIYVNDYYVNTSGNCLGFGAGDSAALSRPINVKVTINRMINARNANNGASLFRGGRGNATAITNTNIEVGQMIVRNAHATVVHFGGYHPTNNNKTHIKISEFRSELDQSFIDTESQWNNGGWLFGQHADNKTQQNNEFYYHIDDAITRGRICLFTGAILTNCKFTVKGNYRTLRNVRTNGTEWGNPAIYVGFGGGAITNTITIDANIEHDQPFPVIQIDSDMTVIIKGSLKSRAGQPCLRLNSAGARVIIEGKLVSSDGVTPVVDGSAGTVIFTPSASANMTSSFTGTTQGTLTVLSGLQ